MASSPDAALAHHFGCVLCGAKPIAVQVTLSAVNRSGVVRRRMGRALICSGCSRAIAAAMNRRRRKAGKEVVCDV